MIEFKNVTKCYGHKTALDNLTLTIPKGSIVGLLGHNGAGKSTAIKSLVSIIQPTSGTILVDGKDLSQNRQAIKKQIGYVPDSPDLFLQLTAREYWNFLAAAYEIDGNLREERIQSLGTTFDMLEHQNELMGSFSHGMRQRAILVGTLLSNPEIWVLDEPMQGLDPQAAFDLKEIIRLHAQKGNTVLFSTHVLDTAQQLCDQLAILKKGELIYNGTVEKLLKTAPNQSLESIYLSMTGRQKEQAEEMHE